MHIGYNLIRIRVVPRKKAEPEELVAIPFWYVPEKMPQTASVPGRAETLPATSNGQDARTQKYLRRVLQGNAARAEVGGGTDGCMTEITTKKGTTPGIVPFLLH